MKKILLLSLLFAACNQQNQMLTKSALADSTITDTSFKATSSNEVTNTPASNWTYEDQADKMDGKKMFFASCTSTNEVYFDFPYGGGSTFTLVVRNMNHENDVMLSISSGQFLTSVEGNSGRIKFDDEPPMKISYSMPADYSSTYVFVHPASKIIAKLKTAKKVMIEADFYEAPKKQGEFDVSGLQWNH